MCDCNHFKSINGANLDSLFVFIISSKIYNWLHINSLYLNWPTFIDRYLKCGYLLLRGLLLLLMRADCDNYRVHFKFLFFYFFYDAQCLIFICHYDLQFIFLFIYIYILPEQCTIFFVSVWCVLSWIVKFNWYSTSFDHI